MSWNVHPYIVSQVKVSKAVSFMRNTVTEMVKRGAHSQRQGGVTGSSRHPALPVIHCCSVEEVRVVTLVEQTVRRIPLAFVASIGLL